MEQNQKKIEDVVAMLDRFMAEGGGHMNITKDTAVADTEKSVTTMGCLDCAAGDMACSVPTLHQGLDGQEE